MMIQDSLKYFTSGSDWVGVSLTAFLANPWAFILLIFVILVILLVYRLSQNADVLNMIAAKNDVADLSTVCKELNTTVGDIRRDQLTSNQERKIQEVQIARLGKEVSELNQRVIQIEDLVTSLDCGKCNKKDLPW